MRIFLCILLFLILLVAVFLLIPVSVIICTDKDGKITVKFKLLFKTFEDGGKSDSSVAKSLKETLGINRLEKKNLKSEIKKSSFFDTLSQSIAQIAALLNTVIDLVKTCKVKRLKLHILCAEEDAAKTAIAYGRCCALAYPLLGYLHSNFKVSKKGTDVNIYCDYDKKEGNFDLEIIISLKIFRILSAFLKTAYKESKRKRQNQNSV